ncbi:fatty acid oxidation complex subunit alpha FadJ [Pleionea mediterranea]|uniref:enoyl-CoA hydratase n=1 Tax=Pleionea mediterranea TaxID=523701 RepID=A0A316FZ14_9GAMM|nr:fatty acid oxidation complex subunit alpha FadJ [Pleionea mediterranea]PWK53385.1 3-hydroxyacyl-CoA dehydrogenase/enoyl-CoA hydratase/3-hydroxybutyryl-CoA epimerase [Pleionea mediterranea]
MSHSKSAFQFELKDNGVGVITIDVPGESQNTLKKEFVAEINDLLNSLEQLDVKGLVLISGKASSFVAGADISMLSDINEASDAEDLAKQGQAIFNRLEKLNIPSVAAINGSCLGGGLELAMACHQRVCTDSSKTKLGLPEVQLGVLPGSGGTQRMPRLTGIATALDLMLTGKQLNAKRAQKAGLVDEVVPVANLQLAAEKRVLNMAKAGHWRKSSDEPSVSWKGAMSASGAQKLALESNSFGRKIIFDKARKTVKGKTKGNYPAPFKIIECIEMGMEHGFEKGLEIEARYFGELVVTPVARQLMNIFFATTELKKDKGVESDVEPKPVKRVGVLGGGLMGAGIAYVSIDKAGKQVRLKDVSTDGVNNALKYSWSLIKKKMKRKQYSKIEAMKVQSRLTGGTDYKGFKQVDLVIEAVFEDLSLKHQMIKDVEQHCDSDTVFATNTSSIPIADIAKASKRPEQVIGLHYFSPVEKMPLLEIIKTEKTSDEVIAQCVAFGKEQGKTVIVVNDGAGFYVNRILAPYMNEAGRMVAKGVPIDTIDKALVQAGFPVGAMTLLDEVGIDVATKVAPILQDAFGERMEPPAMFDKLKEDDRKGRKNGKGFYRYDDDSKGKREVDESIYQLLGITRDHSVKADEIVERCLLMMVNEAARCLDEGIIRSARDGDIGAIFGIGFPPFEGGPFRYMDARGIQTIVERLSFYEKQEGERFKPAEILTRMSEQEKSFYE